MCWTMPAKPLNPFMENLHQWLGSLGSHMMHTLGGIIAHMVISTAVKSLNSCWYCTQLPIPSHLHISKLRWFNATAAARRCQEWLMKPQHMAATICCPIISCPADLMLADSLHWLSWCSKVGKVARMCCEVVTLVERILKVMARFWHTSSIGPLRNLLQSLDFPVDAKLQWELAIHYLEPVCVHAS